jgi:hypothetical protein
LPRIMIQQHYTKGQSQPKSYEEDWLLNPCVHKMALMWTFKS